MSYKRPSQVPVHYPPLLGSYYPPPSQPPPCTEGHLPLQHHQVYQGYFNQGYPYPAVPTPLPNHQYCQYKEYHHHHHNNHQNEHRGVGCFSFLQGCLAALCCCCMMEECCLCLRCCL